MAKQAAVRFARELQKLYRDRTHWLRALVRKPKPGGPPTFNKKKVDRSIEKLQELATECLLHGHAVDGLKRLYNLKRQWHVNSGKGWGVQNKRSVFVHWFERAIPYRNCVYVFWAKRRCRYVGRTVKGKNRPQKHFEKYWFSGVTRIDIYAARGAKNIPKLECLAAHRFQPQHAKVKPAARKWAAKCPICERHRAIRKEMKKIFSLG